MGYVFQNTFLYLTCIMTVDNYSFGQNVACFMKRERTLAFQQNPTITLALNQLSKLYNPQQNSVCTSRLSQTCSVPHLQRLASFNHLNNAHLKPQRWA